MKIRSLKAQTSIGLLAFLLLLVGCVHYQPQPIDAGKRADEFDSRSLNDGGLHDFLEANANHNENLGSVQRWDLERLTLAAFYYQPSLDVARAQWATATAGEVSASERPNPTLSITPAYDTTTKVPSPWIVTPVLDLPIETAGKRGYRIAQAQHLSEAARLKIATVAWQVRSAVRNSMVNLDAALSIEAILQEQQKIQEENLGLLELQYKAGAISAYELTQARTEADRTRFAWLDAEQQEVAARGQLALAIGIPVHALDDVEFSFESLHAIPAEVNVAQARHQASLNRADILAGLAEYAASESALQLEIARQYPDIQLGPGYEYDQGDNKWALGLSLTLPVFNQNQGAIAEAEARRAGSAARFNALQASVFTEVDLALTGYRTALLKNELANTMLLDLQRQEQIARDMLSAGEISRSELIGLQMQISATALARQEALSNAVRAAGLLEDALQVPLGLPRSVWENAAHTTGVGKEEIQP